MRNNNLEKLIEMEEVAMFTHGLLFGIHCLGVFYNIRKKNYIDVTIHAAVAGYDLISAIGHYKELKNENEYR